MKILKIVLITLISVGLLLVATLFLIGFLKPKPAGLRVDTSPGSSIYINGVLVGKTPFQGTEVAGEIFLKLVPDSGGNQNLLPFETKITLVSGIQTVVAREFGTTEDLSSGAIISFDKANANETSIVVISTPDNAQVSIDGTPRGFAPYKTSTISPAEHQVSVKAPGYNDRVITIKTLQGYKLTLFAKLSKNSLSVTQPSPSPTPMLQNFVLVLDTPTGYLRVRTEPATNGEEIAQVKPGEKYLYLDTDTASGWYKIQYEAPKPGLPNGITGWISNQYSKIVDSNGSSVASPSATLRVVSTPSTQP